MQAKYTQWTTPDGVEKIRNWIKEGLSDAEIARRMHISEITLSRWKRAYKPIRDALIRLTVVDGKAVDSRERHAGGGLRKLSSVDRVNMLIEDWIENCKREKKPLTVPGLALALGIGKDALLLYLKEDDKRTAVPAEDAITGEIHFLTISDCIKRAYLAIEDDLVNRSITTNNPSGAIFALKNWYGYADKKDIGVIQGASSSAPLTNAELDQKLQLLLEKAEK